MEVIKREARAVRAAAFSLAAVLALAGRAPAGAEAEAGAVAAPRAIYDEAVSALQAKAEGERARAPELFKAAARGFEAEAAGDYRRWYDAGTARGCAEEPALAVLDYRRFLAHDYFKAEAWDNLAEARKAAATREPGGEGPASWPWALWFLDAASLALGIALLALGLFLFTRRRGFSRLGIALGALALALALASGLSFLAREDMGVMLVETQGRKGDAEVYAAQPAEPWKAGQEAWIIGNRGAWYRIRVGSDVSWVPRDSMELLSAR
jgi:hypothetical protein